MEIRYEIGDNVKGQFAGYSQKESGRTKLNKLQTKFTFLLNFVIIQIQNIQGENE